MKAFKATEALYHFYNLKIKKIKIKKGMHWGKHQS